MFLRHEIRRKDGKEHRAWAVDENRRVGAGAWFDDRWPFSARSTIAGMRPEAAMIEVFDDAGQSAQIALFPEDRAAPVLDCDARRARAGAVHVSRASGGRTSFRPISKCCCMI
jgi:hypothetical protein